MWFNIFLFRAEPSDYNSAQLFLAGSLLQNMQALEFLNQLVSDLKPKYLIFKDISILLHKCLLILSYLLEMRKIEQSLFRSCINSYAVLIPSLPI